MSQSAKSKVALREYNSLRVDAYCREMTMIRSVSDLAALQPRTDYLILGGGSNILCADYVDAHLLKNEILGQEVIFQDDNVIHLRVGGGENWHQLVLATIEAGWGGLENLTLIPGTVGAAPVQNIGAYGVEQDQLMVSLTAYDLHRGGLVEFATEDCDFGYRDSLFKTKQPGRYLITHVVYRLTRRNHRIQVSYGDIVAQLEADGVVEPGIAEVSRAVAAIRTYKLPDPSQIPNAGSFFKNPVVLADQYRELKHQYPTMPTYSMADDTYKIPAGWLIDQCGYKGRRSRDAGTYYRQALVIVNHDAATGREIWAFAQEIQQVVMETYGVLLVPEVNRWGF